MMFILMIAADRPWTLMVPSMQVWGAALGIGVFATALAYILYFRILATAGATNLLLVTLLIPVGAILLGTLVLGERLETKHFIGMALIAVGLAAIDGRIFRHSRTRTKSANPESG
jgi:drug/metabolite transporter (DMT)-like permease